MRKATVILITCIVLASSEATAEVIYTSQSRHVLYEIELGDDWSTKTYEDSASASDFGIFEEDLYLNSSWPDVEGRASAIQSSNMTGGLVTATGTAHTHAYVEEDQTQAFVAALGESTFSIDFELTNAARVVLSGETGWVRSTVDPPKDVSVAITLHDDDAAIFSHVRKYTNPEGVGQDDGDSVFFEDNLAPGSYSLEIIAHTETHSQGPWRQYAEGTASFDITMTLSALGDLTGDCTVDFNDLLALFALWGTCPAPCAGDLADPIDGVVDFEDLLALFGNWG